MKTNYDNICLSEKTTSGMTLTIDDQKFIKLLFDRQDEVTQEYVNDSINEMLIKILLELKNIHIEIRAINIEIKNIYTEITDIRKILSDHELRLTIVENKIK